MNRGMMATVVDKLTPERRRQLTREALIDAAAEVFAEKGYAGASLEEIAASAGFTRGAIYSNFSGKEELLLAVIDRDFDKELDAYREVVDRRPGESPLERAAQAVTVWGDFESHDLLLLSLELHGQALRNPAVRERVAEFDRSLLERAVAFVEGQFEEQDLRSDIPPRDIVLIGRAAEWGLRMRAAVDPDHADEYRAALGRLFELLGTDVEERSDQA